MTRMIRIMIILRITRIIHMKKMIEITRISTSTNIRKGTRTIINKMITLSHKANIVVLSSLTHIFVRSFNVSSSIK